MSDQIAHNESPEISLKPSAASSLSLEAQGQMRSDTYRKAESNQPVRKDKFDQILPRLFLESPTDSNSERDPVESRRTYREFIPPRGTAANPTIDTAIAMRESEALRKHFDLIPGKANRRFIDGPALQNYLNTNNQLSEDDRKYLGSALSHLNRIQRSWQEELFRENSGISRSDIYMYPAQEYELQKEFTLLALAKERFPQMAGSDGTLSLRQLKDYTERRSTQGASEAELYILNKIAKQLNNKGMAWNGGGRDQRAINKLLEPMTMVDFGVMKPYSNLVRQ